MWDTTISLITLLYHNLVDLSSNNVWACGLVGLAGKLEFKDEGTLKRLLLLDFFRGPDSTGLAVVNKAISSAKVVKMASHPIDLFDTERFKKALTGHGSSVFLGHNRAATKGVVNGYNAHPFECGHIVGAHNGTLEVSSMLELESALGEKYDVDSHAIFAAIEKLGVEATVPMLRGAWALVWVNLEDRTLNFLRNKERPFWYAYSKEFDHLFWASEWPMIEAATRMSTVPYDMHTEESTGFRFWSTDVDMHYKYDLEALQLGAEKPCKPVVKELKGKEPWPVTTYVHGQQAPFRGPPSGTHSQTTTTSTTTSPGSNLVKSLFGTNKKPFGDYLSEDRFDVLAAHGCSWCREEVEYADKGIVIIEKQDIVLCNNCSSGDANSVRIYIPDPNKIAQAA